MSCILMPQHHLVTRFCFSDYYWTNCLSATHVLLSDLKQIMLRCELIVKVSTFQVTLQARGVWKLGNVICWSSTKIPDRCGFSTRLDERILSRLSESAETLEKSLQKEKIIYDRDRFWSVSSPEAHLLLTSSVSTRFDDSADIRNDKTKKLK